MDPLSVTASIIAVLQLTNQVIRYMTNMAEAPKQSQLCIIEISNLLGLLISLRYRAEQAAAEDPWFEQLRLLNVDDGPLQQYREALVLLKSRTQVGDGARNTKKRLLWAFRKEEVSSILGRIERLKSLVSVALEMDHFKLSQAIREDVRALCETLYPLTASMPGVEAGISSLQLDTLCVKGDTAFIRDAVPSLQADARITRDVQGRQQLEAMLQWLSPTEFPAQQQDIISRKQEGTAQWFLLSSQFQAWISRTDKTLFCPGIPGAGKTMIAAIAIDHLHQINRQNGSIGIAYAFCTYKANHNQSARSVIAATLKQLVRSHPNAVGLLLSIYEEHQRRGSRPSLNDLTELLLRVCSAYATVYMVIDALDECSNNKGARDQVIASLRQIQARTGLSLLFTSRPIPEVTHHFQDALTIDIRADEEDVRAFVAGQTKILPDLIRRDADLQREVENKIALSVDGMFLLARLHLDSLRDKTTRKQVRKQLADLRKSPEALSQAYDGALERIDGQLPGHRHLARQVLSWITFAQRLLTKEELRHALAIEPGEKALDQEALVSVQDIVTVCAGLVVVDEESNVFRLVHYTTEEYFERVRMQWIPDAEETIATACLTYLCFDTFNFGGVASNEDLQQKYANNLFLRYSARFWAVHLRPVQTTPVARLALDFLCRSSCVDNAAQANGAHYSGRRLNGLHLTALYGLQNLTNLLLEDERFGSQVDAKNDRGATPLNLAAAHGHEAVVKLLLATGRVDIDSSNLIGVTPLSNAAYCGHEAIATLLLAAGKVDVNSSDKWGRTPLHNAASRGHEAVVRVLLATGEADTNRTENDFNMTPLQMAVHDGYEATAKVLLAMGKADINSKSVGGDTALSAAAGRGHEDVVKLLLATGNLDVNNRNRFGKTALILAASDGHEGIVRLLLTIDNVDVNSQDGIGMTALMHGASRGRERIVKLLLSARNVEVDQQDPTGNTALMIAVLCDQAAVVRLLLEAGNAHINNQDHIGQTALILAARYAHEDMVRLLLSHDMIEIDRKDRAGNTALSVAAMRGKEAVVRLLLATGKADIESQDSAGRSALWHAVKEGHEAIARVLSGDGSISARQIDDPSSALDLQGEYDQLAQTRQMRRIRSI